MSDSETPKPTLHHLIVYTANALLALNPDVPRDVVDNPKFILPDGKAITHPVQMEEFHDYSRKEIRDMLVFLTDFSTLVAATEMSDVVREFPRKLDLPPSIKIGDDFLDPEAIARRFIDNEEAFNNLCFFALETEVSMGDRPSVALRPLLDLLFNFRTRLSEALGLEPSSERSGP